MTKKQELIDYVIGNEFIAKPSLQNKFTKLLNEALTEQLRLHGVGICLEKKEKKLLTMLLAKDINNLSNIVEDNEILEGYKTDYRKLAKKISEA